MRFFEQHIVNGESDIFYKLPVEFTKNSDKKLLRYSVGAALYMPATRDQVADEIIVNKHPACTSIVLDLEDALGDLQVEQGEDQLLHTLKKIQQAMQMGQLKIEKIPLLFVRVRNTEHLSRVINKLGSLQHLLTGYVFPKFSMGNGEDYLQQVVAQNALGYKLYVMPILESSEIINKETRLQELLAIRKLLEKYESIVLNVRIGSTDFCGLLGLRRSINQTVYEIITVQECFADIINVFTRDESPFVISGSVWEYFGSEKAEAGLLREVAFDQLNGLIGKTIIHPTHLVPVQSNYAVTHEEYTDATRIILNAEGAIGVEKSDYNNKMNEIKPHYTWAQRMLLRSQAFGVLNEGYRVEDLLKKKVRI